MPSEITDFSSDYQINEFYAAYINAVKRRSTRGNDHHKKILGIDGAINFLANICTERPFDNPLSYDQIRGFITGEMAASINSYIKYTVFKIYSYDVFSSFLRDIASRYKLTHIGYDDKLHGIFFTVKDLTIIEKDPVSHTNIICNLGHFKVYLTNNTGYDYRDISNISNSYQFTVTAQAVGNNKPRKTSATDYECYHPHIYKGSVCQGSYKLQQAYFDFEQVDILSYIYNVCEILTHYNPKSIHHPGADISLWIGAKCAVCYGYIGEEEAKVACSKSGSFMHEACSIKVNENYYHPDNVKICSSCNTDVVDYVTVGPRVYSCKPCIEKTLS